MRRRISEHTLNQPVTLERVIEDGEIKRRDEVNLWLFKDICEFRLKLDSDSSRNWTAIPAQTGH